MREHTKGRLQLWTSNSFRRFGTSEGWPVCEPITQNDGHPDLHFRNGGADGPDARRLVACWNACESMGEPEAEVSALQTDRKSLNGMATLLANARRDRDELIEALRLPMVLYAIGYISETAGDGGDHTEAQGREADKATKIIHALLAKHAPKVPG